ncbi:MAG: hypothetical protein IPL77_09915 [Flavobacteriales bacterium]|nr:hypothetical protein [Flavobacteriales bacterium]
MGFLAGRAQRIEPMPVLREDRERRSSDTHLLDRRMIKGAGPMVITGHRNN